MFIPYKSISTKLSLLNTFRESIQKEYIDNFSKLEFRDFTNEQKDFITTHGRGYPIGYQSYFAADKKVEGMSGWHIAPLFAEDRKYDLNTQHLPVLTRVLEMIGMTKVCAINVLDPDQSLDWHIDQDYIPGVQLIRIMWGLECGDQKSIIQLKDDASNIIEREFKDGEFYIFHPLVQHRVENKSLKSRAVLCIDYIDDTKYSGATLL